MRTSSMALPAILCILCAALPMAGQTRVYQPLVTWNDPQRAVLGRWESFRQIRTAEVQAAGGTARITLPGLRPRNVELLLDALQRKSVRIVRPMSTIQSMLPKMARHTVGINRLHGYMTEALAIDRNGWRYEPNASDPHVDAWDANGRSIQIKFHSDGNPATYVRDMVSDSKADRFAVPDDHVQALKDHLRNTAKELAGAGDREGAAQALRNARRVCGTGVESSEVTSGVKKAVRVARAENAAVYLSLGAAIALSIGPAIWDYASGNTTANQALYRASRSLSVLGVAFGADVALRFVRSGAWRGTLRGNVIVGTAIFITEATWLLYENGWSRAFYQPQFYEGIGGSVGGLALGIAGSAAAVAWCPGPGWVVGGAALVVGAATGTVGYLGGRAGAHMILELVAPKMLQQQQRETLKQLNEQIDQKIAKAVLWPPAG